jgi:hypothetical protein
LVDRASSSSAYPGSFLSFSKIAYFIEQAFKASKLIHFLFLRRTSNCIGWNLALPQPSNLNNYIFFCVTSAAKTGQAGPAYENWAKGGDRKNYIVERKGALFFLG